MNRLDALIAKSEIEDVMFRYARGVDRRDWDMVQTCFHPDAVDIHGDFRGSPAAFIAWVAARHAAIPFSAHFLGNCLITFQGDLRASAETYFIAIQRREPVSGDTMPAMDYEVFGRYCDVFEDRGTGWRIAAREVVYDATRTQPSTDHLRKLTGVIGQRDRTDPVYRMPQG